MPPQKTFAERAAGWIPTLVLLFVICQPVLDMLVFAAVKLDLSTLPTAILRFALAGLVFLLSFLLSRKKWVYYVLMGVCATYLTGHFLACRQYGMINFTEDLTEQLRILMLPALTVSFATLLRRNPDALESFKKGLFVNLLIILASEILSLLTHTEPYTYTDKDIGIQGWFLWPNSQSAIISLLSPLVILYALQRWKDRLLPLFLVSLGSFALLYCNATRLAYASLVATGLCLSAAVALIDRTKLRHAGVILATALLFVVLYPFSPMRENRRQMAVNAILKQSLIDDAAAAHGVPAGADSTRNLEALAAAYHYDLQGVVDRFGIETTAAQYEYTLRANRIFDKRLKRLNFCRLLRQQAPMATRLFGLEIGTTRQQTELYDFYRNVWTPGVEVFEVENDLNGVYFHCGIVGLLLMGGLLLGVGLRSAVWLLARLRRRQLCLDWAACFIAYGICLAYTVFTASFLRQTNASGFFAFLMAALWVTSTREKLPGLPPMQDHPQTESSGKESKHDN